MTNFNIQKTIKWIFPSFLSVFIFSIVNIIQKSGASYLPIWCIAILSALIGTIIVSYIIQLRLLNRIGGGEILFIAFFIIVFMLLPESSIEQYPEKTSVKLAENFDLAWKKIYGKNLFEEFSLHQHLLQYSQSLASFDIHRAGQVGIFSLFGITLGICFLFPIDPSNRIPFMKRILMIW